jgi:capsule polysaccharide modification protein KpsS
MNRKGEFVRASNKSLGAFRLENKNIVKTINYLQSVSYRINRHVLDRILRSFRANIDIGEDYVFKMHPETKNISYYKEERNEGKVQEILQQNSKYYANFATLATAILLCDEFRFYHPLFID